MSPSHEWNKVPKVQFLVRLYPSSLDIFFEILFPKLWYAMVQSPEAKTKTLSLPEIVVNDATLLS